MEASIRNIRARARKKERQAEARKDKRQADIFNARKLHEERAARTDAIGALLLKSSKRNLLKLHAEPRSSISPQ